MSAGHKPNQQFGPLLFSLAGREISTSDSILFCDTFNHTTYDAIHIYNRNLQQTGQ